MHEFTVMAPPNFLLTSLLRHSSLVYIIFSFINESPYQIFNQQYNDDALLPDDTSVKKAIESLNFLSQGNCINENDIVEINKIKLLINNKKFSDADELSYNFSKKLISKDCAPIILGDSFGTTGLDRKMNYTYVSRVNVSQLNIKNNISEISFKSENLCTFQCNNTNISPDISDVYQEELALEKKQIFINWLNKAALEYNVSVFLLPSEYLIYLSKDKQYHWLCEYPSNEFECFDLQDEFFKYYAENEEALFHDAAHLNKLGVKFSVDQIINKLNTTHN